MLQTPRSCPAPEFPTLNETAATACGYCRRDSLVQALGLRASKVTLAVTLRGRDAEGSHFTDGLRLSGVQGHTGQTTLPDFTPGVPQGCCRTKPNSLPRGKCLPRNHFLIVARCPTTAHEFRRQSHVRSLIREAKPTGNLCNESDIQQTKTCPASPAIGKTHASVIACSAH